MPCVWGVWRGGLSRSSASKSMCGWSWAGMTGLGGAGWFRGREMVGPGVSRVLVAGGSCGGFSSRVLWWCLGGLWTEMGGMCGARSRLVDLWVMHGMVMDETQHVFLGGGVGELLSVCQQEALAV